MKVWIASFPRSGNTLLRIVLRALYGVSSRSVYPERFDPGTDPLFPNAEAPIGVEFEKTHGLEETSGDAPALYVVRDGRDAYVSYAHLAQREQPESWRGRDFAAVLGALVESPDHFGGWSRHVKEWTERDAPTAVIRFEELLTHPERAARGGFAQLGITLPATSGELPSLQQMRERKDLKFRRGVNGSWRDEMPADVEATFWDLHGPTMELLGYAR